MQTTKKTNIGKFVAIFPSEKSKIFLKKSGTKLIVKPNPKTIIIGKINLELIYGILNFPLVCLSANSD